MIAVPGRHADLWLVRADDGSISTSASPEPGPLQILPKDVLTPDGELHLSATYVSATEAIPKAERSRAPFFADLDHLAVTDIQSHETIREDERGNTIRETRMTVAMETSRDRVIFETPPSNVIGVSKRTYPTRWLGWGQIVGGVLLDSSAWLIASKARRELSEGSRGTAYTFSGAMVLVSLPLLTLGGYMVLVPERREPLW